MFFILFLEKKNQQNMSRNAKPRRQGDPIQAPGNLADQINQDRAVLTKKPRQKQKRKFEEEDDDQVRVFLCIHSLCY